MIFYKIMISKFEKINEKEEPPHSCINFYIYTMVI